ncbi:MAG: hypothetical protein KBC46_03425 [Ferrovibrio sp.]|nr:hypothetical protein [Ferrovibrio sp.]
MAKPRVEFMIEVVRIVAALAGLALIGYGAWLAYEPAGYFIPGAVLFAASAIGALRNRP